MLGVQLVFPTVATGHPAAEIMSEVNARLALRKILEMTHGRQYLVIASQIFGKGFGFGGRFDDNE